MPVVIRDRSGDGLVPSVVSVAGRRDHLCRPRSAAPAADRRGAHGVLGEAVHGQGRRRRPRRGAAVSVPRPAARPAASCGVGLGDREFTPPEISAFILRELKRRAEEFFAEQGEIDPEVDRAVITVPAYFNDAQRTATRDAGRIAGLDVLRIINEPTAASLAYGLDKRHTGIIAVYDLGGGTFDISILRVEDGVFQVLSTNGDTHLGGDDIDQLLMQQVLADGSSGDGASAATPARRPGDSARLSFRRKWDLSEHERDRHPRAARTGKRMTPRRVRGASSGRSSIARSGPAGRRWPTPASSRRRSTRSCSSAAPRAFRSSAGWSQELFGRTPHSELNPDEVVALGAAVQADILVTGNREMLLLDVTPLSLGIETMGGVMSKIILRNSTIPATGSEMFTTSVDNQTAVDIHVLQGERELVADNRSLARFKLRGIPPMPAGLPRVQVQFQIDANGILSVTARELRTDIEQTIEVKPSYGLTDEEVERMLLESFEHAEADFAARLLIEARNEAETVIRATEKSLRAPDFADIAKTELARG